MSIRGWVFAAMYDAQMARAEKAGLLKMREDLLAAAKGDVVEIGSGTGANVPLYSSAVRSLTLTEPESPLVRKIEARVGRHGRKATVLRAPAEDLPFEDNSFDTAVSTLVLCGVSDQPRALRELRRVLRPGGQLLFLEHVRSGDPKLARHQNRLNWLNRAMVGCECNRPTLDTIQAAGFSVDEVEHGTLPKAPSFVSPLIVGRATVPVAENVAAR